MYVRDHARPAFHAALGIDPTDYDYRVFRITSDIARQVFPVELDIDSPIFRAGLERMRRITEGQRAARAQGGLGGKLRGIGLTVAAGATFLRLFLLPAKRNDAPATVRMSPAW